MDRNVTPGSDAVLFMGRAKFEFGATQINKSTPVVSNVERVYMIPGRLSSRREFTPVRFCGSVSVYMILPQNVMPARVIPTRVHPGSCDFHLGTKIHPGVM